jgi:NAD(P)-dependent dehydrogenase (short-subunit alcohol dehydrogenase family)
MTTGSLPQTVSGPYSISKLAMNVLMLELKKQEEQVEEKQGSRISYQAVNPGHCKTGLNGFRGKRDPFEGVKVLEEMAVCERGKYEAVFWFWGGDEDNGIMERVE